MGRVFRRSASGHIDYKGLVIASGIAVTLATARPFAARTARALAVRLGAW
jgi:hypothetical protein